MALCGAQLRDSLFESSVAGGRHLREEAVDKALELARSAPLEMQGEVRRGAGRIDSLLGGDGLQPVRSSIVRSSRFRLGGVARTPLGSFSKLLSGMARRKISDGWSVASTFEKDQILKTKP